MMKVAWSSKTESPGILDRAEICGTLSNTIPNIGGTLSSMAHSGTEATETTLQEPKGIKLIPTEEENVVLVPVDILNVDRVYQRPATKKMEDIGNNWQDKLAGVVTLSKRADESLWIIDGQHRVGGAIIAGKTHVRAIIHEGLSIEEEAYLFDKLNNIRSVVSAIDRFRARLVYKDPEALEIKRIVEEFGGSIASRPGRQTRDDTAVRAVASLERVHKQGGANTLRQVLTVIRDAWGGIDFETTNEMTLGGLRFLIERQGRKIDYQRLVLRLREQGLSNIRRMAHAHGQIFGGSGSKNFYRATVEVYNKNMRPRNRLRP